MAKYKKIIGAKGEKIAREFLEKKGYEFVAKNFRMWGGEIDLVMKDLDLNEIIFVEVKTRSKEDYQQLDETLSYRQLKNIKKIIPFFLLRYNLENTNWRIDHIGIIYKSNVIFKIEHLIGIN